MIKFIFLSLLLVFPFVTISAQVAPFKNGERAVFAGNSITDGGHYHSYIWLYYITHFPNEKIEIFNAGIGGDVAGQIVKRIDDDVFNHKPTVVAVTFGMNDVGYSEYLKPNADSFSKQKINECYNSYLQIEKRLKEAPNVRKILMASSPYDETVKGTGNYFPGKSNAMLQVANFQQEAAKKNRWDFVDFNRPMTTINAQEQQKDSTFTLCGQDRIHPGNDGHLVMAYIFLKAQGLSGKDVANIHIDVPKKAVTQSVNCKISLLKATPENIEFKYLANSLPYPIDTIPRGWNEKRKQSDALKLIPFIEEFDKEMLVVNGLSANTNYMLKIDKKEIGRWKGNEFENGINMAELTTTPQYKQALSLMYLNEERWEIERRFRQYAWVQFDFFRDKGLLFADNEEALDTLNANVAKNGFLAGNRDNYLKARLPEIRQTWQQEMNLLIDRMYSLNKPKEHLLEIEAVL